MTTNGKTFNTIIAVDVSKATLDIYIWPSGKHCQIANSTVQIKRFLKPWFEDSQVLVACEATGGYERALLTVMVQGHLAGLKASGRKVRLFATARGQQAKTDRIDAKAIADYARYQVESGKLKLYVPPSKAVERLAELNARRSDLVAMRMAEQNRLEMTRDALAIRMLQRHISQLKRDIVVMEKEIAKLIKEDDVLAQKASLLGSLKGIGPVTTATLLAQMPELGTLSKAEAAALTGLAPFNRDSGKSNKPRHIHAGRAQVRKCLYMAAMVAIKSNHILAKKFAELKARGKPFKVAITAIMRKIIIILNKILGTNTPWKHAQNT